MKKVEILLLCLVVGSLSFLPAGAWAQKGTLLPDQIKAKKKKGEKKKKSGWTPDLDASFNFSFAQSDGVVGVPDGTTLNFGLQLKGGATYINGPHEWRTTFLLVHTQTKLPTINAFVKSADKAELETMYTYFFPSAKWFGLFASLKGETALLPGFLVRDANTNLSIKAIDGTISTAQLLAQAPYKLTDGFAPFLLKPSAGASLTPYNKKEFRLNFKLGVGAVMTWTQDGLRIEDDAATADVIELARMQDYIQIGGEARISLNGVLFGKLLNYTLSGGAMIPFYTSVDTSKFTFAELINYDATLKLGIKVFNWMSINYSLAVLYVPLIQPQVQVTNNLVVSFTWSIL